MAVAKAEDNASKKKLHKSMKKADKYGGDAQGLLARSQVRVLIWFLYTLVLYMSVFSPPQATYVFPGTVNAASDAAARAANAAASANGFAGPWVPNASDASSSSSSSGPAEDFICGLTREQQGGNWNVGSDDDNEGDEALSTSGLLGGQSTMGSAQGKPYGKRKRRHESSSPDCSSDSQVSDFVPTCELVIVD